MSKVPLVLSECVHVQSWEEGGFRCSIFRSQGKLHRISLLGREVFHAHSGYQAVPAESPDR